MSPPPFFHWLVLEIVSFVTFSQQCSLLWSAQGGVCIFPECSIHRPAYNTLGWVDIFPEWDVKSYFKTLYYFKLCILYTFDNDKKIVLLFKHLFWLTYFIRKWVFSGKFAAKQFIFFIWLSFSILILGRFCYKLLN